jgi:hypothetical protein
MEEELTSLLYSDEEMSLKDVKQSPKITEVKQPRDLAQGRDKNSLHLRATSAGQHLLGSLLKRNSGVQSQGSVVRHSS